MKLAALLLLLVAPAVADSIPAPIPAFAFTGVQSTIYTPWLYSVASGSQADFVSDLFLGSFATGQFAATLPATGWLQGTTSDYTFQTATSTVSGTFTGTEYVWSQPRTTGLRQWDYRVTGTFTQSIARGTATVAITSATYEGTSAVPEPATWGLLATGILALGLRWKLRFRGLA
jgi:hypothetical protein